MKTIYVLLATLLLAVPASAVTVTCVSEGGNVVRIDYNASDETVPPIAFALTITVNNGATITRVYDYKVGDSNTASPGYGIFPSLMQFDQSGKIINWGSPISNAGLNTPAVSLGMAARYPDRTNAPRASGTLCRILVAPGAAQTVNVAVAQDTNAGGIVLEDAAVTTKFTGIGTTLNGSTPPPPPAPPAAPLSISYPATSGTGQYNVSWSASNGATSYQLERSNNAGSTWTQIYSNANLSYSENIGNGTYRYRVRATNTAGSSSWTTGSTGCVVTITSTSTIYEAENAVLSGCVVSTTIPGYTGTGFADYKNNSSDYIQWTVNVPAAGQYQLQFRYGLASGNRPLEIRINGVVAAASLAFPSTGSFANWSTVSMAATLNSGTNTVRATAIGSSGANIDNLQVINSGGGPPVTIPPVPASITYPASSSTGQYTVRWAASTGAASYQLERSNDGGDDWTRIYSGSVPSYSQTVNNGRYRYRARATNSAGSSNWRTGTTDCVVTIASTSTTYEAENAVLRGCVVSTAVPGYTGTGFADYINAGGDYVQWTVNVPASGQYQLRFRYGLARGNRPLEIRVNGVVAAASLAFPSTGSFTNWSTLSMSATLNSGTNTVRATAIGYSGANIDNLQVSGSGYTASPATTNSEYSPTGHDSDEDESDRD